MCVCFNFGGMYFNMIVDFFYMKCCGVKVVDICYVFVVGLLMLWRDFELWKVLSRLI